ncbi:Transcriptional activator protein BglJ [Serratia fonticola]|uniref:LuxR C-terminal-related transcriptional regulator n=1 Tax=Serratia fonticola TaxID=47917 RepID=UPI002179A49C|nr:LuxR C-terminal-related transcriptional regulator [Serratia fonticola]CAI2040434.1 Transcriptional activator protein BglJ [Serratia fonticola]
MTQKFASNRIAILSQNSLFRLGMAKFFRDFNLGCRCVLSISSVLRLPQKIVKSSAGILIIEYAGKQQGIEKMAQQLLMINNECPTLNVVVYTESRNVADLLPLMLHRKFSLITQRDLNEKIRHDLLPVLAGYKVCTPTIKNSAECLKQNTKKRLDALSCMEREVLNYLFAGFSVKNIATLKNRSIKTISAHKRNSMRKLGACNNAELFHISERWLKNKL